MSALFIRLMRNLLYLHDWRGFIHSQLSLGWRAPCECRALLYLVNLLISQVSCNFLSATRQFSLRNLVLLTVIKHRLLIFSSLVILRSLLELGSFLIIEFNLVPLLGFEFTYQFVHVVVLLVLFSASHSFLLLLRCLKSQWQLIEVIIHARIISNLHEHLILGIFVLLNAFDHPIDLLSRQLRYHAHVAISRRLQNILLTMVFWGSSTSYFGFLVPKFLLTTVLEMLVGSV